MSSTAIPVSQSGPIEGAGPWPAGDVPGEWYAPTQPYPTKPPAYDRQGYADDYLVNFTPELNEAALKMAARYKTRTDLHAAPAWPPRTARSAPLR